MVVSASINWGKRCPHFLAETRPPFFATIRARNGKTFVYTRRTKKTLFAAAPLVTRTRRSGHRNRNRNPSLRFRLRDGRRDASFFKRGKRETVRRDARVDARVFFSTRIRAFFFRATRAKSFAKTPRAANGGGRRVVGRLRAVRPTARAFTRKPPSTPKHTRSEDCVGTSLLHQPKSRSELG